MDKVCAIVVTFNRKELLRTCIKALQKQTRSLQGILVVDNASTDGTANMLASDFPSVKVITLEHNTGGAGGFYSGLKQAHESGYDMFWIMDDDAEPEPNALDLLLSEPGTSREEVACVCGKVLDRAGGIAVAHRGYFNSFDEIIATSVQRPVPKEAYETPVVEIDTLSFVGPLIKRAAVDKIGYPMKELFIHHDDIEYSIRLRQIGRILLIGASNIRHFGEASQIDTSGVGASRSIDYGKLWIRYYGKRNQTYIAKREAIHAHRFLLSLLRCLYQVLRESAHVLSHEDHKLRRIILPYLAIYNGLRGNFDNDVPRRWLYGKW